MVPYHNGRRSNVRKAVAHARGRRLEGCGLVPRMGLNKVPAWAYCRAAFLRRHLRIPNHLPPTSIETKLGGPALPGRSWPRCCEHGAKVSQGQGVRGSCPGRGGGCTPRATVPGVRSRHVAGAGTRSGRCTLVFSRRLRWPRAGYRSAWINSRLDAHTSEDALRAPWRAEAQPARTGSHTALPAPPCGCRPPPARWRLMRLHVAGCGQWGVVPYHSAERLRGAVVWYHTWVALRSYRTGDRQPPGPLSRRPPIDDLLTRIPGAGGIG